MGKLYNGLRRIIEKMKNSDIDETGYSMARNLIEKFIVITTYEDTYLMKMMVYNKDKTLRFVPRIDGRDENVFIDCLNFGILVSPKDEISTHT